MALTNTSSSSSLTNLHLSTSSSSSSSPEDTLTKARWDTRNQPVPVSIKSNATAPVSSSNNPSPSSTTTTRTAAPPPGTTTTTTSGYNIALNRQSTASFTATSLVNRTALLNLAALARDRTTSAIASLSDPALRSRTSSSNLSRQSVALSTTNPPQPKFSRTGNLQAREDSLARSRPDSPRRSSSSFSQTPTLRAQDLATAGRQPNPLLDTDPPSQSYEHTDSNTPIPTTVLPNKLNKMHQTSSRLLRMTEDDRPFTRDFKDLFSTLVVSLPLSAHRVRLTRVEHSFLSEEAINNLGSLKFSQSNRMPDPKDNMRIVTTTTTTTFSMAKEMARSICQRFLESRFIESADGRQAKEFTMRGSVWQLTPKGIHILERFCSRNGIQQKHISDLLGSSRNTMQLVILERDSITDKLDSDRSTIEVVFRRFIGQNGPNIKSSTASADSDSLNEYKDGLLGVKMAGERKIGSPPRTVFQTFTGKAATDWLMDCCTTIDRRETLQMVIDFIDADLIWCVQNDRSHVLQFPQDSKFQATKNSIYQLTQKGKDVLSMISSSRPSNGDEPATPRAGVSRDSNTQKLDKILNDAALRLLFRENLRDTHCEENLSFYLDVDEFLRSCKAAIRVSGTSSTKASSTIQGLDAVKETMASAYGIYNAFLAPGSPCELNIDHLLRNQLATRMTKSVGVDAAMVESLKEVSKLFEEAQLSVFKLMASDSVPKFMKSSKYEQTLKNYDFDSIGTSGTAQPKYNTSIAPERTMSKAGR